MSDLYTTGGPARLGSLGISPLLVLVKLPSILAEWAAMIPLLCHITNGHHDHDFIGQAALRGRIHISLFPRLGVLRGIAQLLEEGSEFLDRASSIGGRRSDVWDVNWGSVFPCANGAASALVAASALRGAQQTIRIPERILPISSLGDTSSIRVESEAADTSRPLSGVTPSKVQRNNARRLTIHENADLSTLNWISSDPSTTQVPTCRIPTPDPPVTSQQEFRRFQTLHVMEFKRAKVSMRWYHSISHIASTRWYQILSSIFLGVIASILCLYGLYGTACAVLFGAGSRIACLFLHVRRPPRFLENNELHNACMLVGIHQNSSIWYLYIGDRGVVDSILNKTMITLSTHSSILFYWFKLSHFVQLLAMTFVAAQKGWDGISMIVFMIAADGFPWYPADLQIARRWLEKEGITVRARSFEFSGRTSMIGAIQNFSGSKTSQWIDGLVPASPRREAWLERLGAAAGSEPGKSYRQLDDFDKRWVDIQLTLTARGVALLQNEFPLKE